MNAHVANFNSEVFWKSNRLVSLPSMTDEQSDIIVWVMDELQFVFIESDEDVLLTRIPFNVHHKKYLSELNINFYNNSTQLAVSKDQDLSYFRENIFELISESNDLLEPKGQHELIPFAVLPGSHQQASKLGVKVDFPPLDIIIKVNSKAYSYRLMKRLFNETSGYLITSVDELIAKGKELLDKGSFLIKDTFGVSGKGNLKIESEFFLGRIAKILKKQEDAGREVLFIVEPYLDKDFDFCCQFFIDKKGKVEILATHQLNNDGFSFSGCETIDSAAHKKLVDIGYFEKMHLIANELFKEGYHGDVCIDSLFLKDGNVVPVLEINARKSMSLINYSLNRLLQKKFDKSGVLFSKSLSIPKNIRFSDLLDGLRSEQILYLKPNLEGIIPLSANSFEINGVLGMMPSNKESYKGLFYFSVVAESSQRRNHYLDRLSNLFEKLLIKEL